MACPLPIFNKASTLRKERCIAKFGARAKNKALRTAKKKEQQRKNVEKLGPRRLRLFKAAKRLAFSISPDDLRAMPYGLFLQTDYWKCVRFLVFQRDRYQCRKCKRGGKLQVHHKTYAHHGEEHLHLGDLQTLCHSCHKAHHSHSEHHAPRSEGALTPIVNRIATTAALSPLTTATRQEQDASRNEIPASAAPTRPATHSRSNDPRHSHV